MKQSQRQFQTNQEGEVISRPTSGWWEDENEATCIAKAVVAVEVDWDAEDEETDEDLADAVDGGSSSDRIV